MTTWRKIWKVSWRAAVCVLLLLWIFQLIFYDEGRLAWQGHEPAWANLTRWDRWRIAWQFGPPELWHTLTMVGKGQLALSLLAMGSTLILGMIRWQMVLKVQGLELPFKRTTQISLIAHFFNSFLLGSTGGDLLKAYYVARETHHKKLEAVVTVVVDRLLGLFSMLVFACALMPLNLPLLAASRSTRAVALTVFVMTLACGALMGVAFWGGVSSRFPRARAWLKKAPKGELLERSLDACREFGKDKGFLFRSFAISTVLNLACVWQIMAVAAGFDLHLPLREMALIVPMIIIISALPVTPSGLGVRENLYFLLLAAPPMRIAPSKALLVSLVAYGGSLFWSTVGGFVYATLKEKEHLEEFTRPNPAEAGKLI